MDKEYKGEKIDAGTAFLHRSAGVQSHTTVRPSRPQGIGRQSGIPVTGLPDEEFRSGWANVQSNNYWSSSSNANNTNNAWIVNMWNGNVNNNNKTNNNYVWPVRSGEWCPPDTSHLTSGPRGRSEARGDFLFCFKNLHRNYLKCRKNKRSTINALKFEMDAEENLLKLSEELQNRSYHPSRSVCFVVEKPKMREIIAADFRDRIVHHLLVERLEAIYEPVFIYDSYACRKNKGLHKGIERVKGFIRKGSGNGRKRLHFVHLDIRNFFMTIDKEILYGILKKKVKDEDLLRLAHIIIFNNPAAHCIIKGNKSLIKHLPPHKSLFHAPENKGLPVGNLTSQFFANLYLNELDQYVKHVLKCRHYVRYCDDFLILDESPDRLMDVKERIRGFVTERLHLSLNDKYNRIMPVSNGMDFIGYIIRQDYTLVRRRTVNNLKTKLNGYEKRLVSDAHGIRMFRYDYETIEKLRSVLASYLGHMKWANTFNLRKAVLEQYGFLKEYFDLDGGRVRPLCRYQGIFPSVRSQYLYFKNRFRGAALFFQVGCFCEFYGGTLGKGVLDLLGLKRLEHSARGAKFGFPIRLARKFAKRLADKGIPVVVIRETERYIGRIKERLPVLKIRKREEEIYGSYSRDSRRIVV